MKAFIRKEIYHILRDYRSILILFGMPVVQILIFGYTITNELKETNIAVIYPSGDEMSKKLVSRIDASAYFHVAVTGYRSFTIEEEFRKNNIRMALVIGSDFEAKSGSGRQASVQIIGDASDPNAANLLTNYLRAIITGFMGEQIGKPDLPLHFVTESRMLYNPSLKSVFMFVPGTIVIILMLVSAMMTSISIAREKETGTMEVLLVSPLKPLHVILGKVAPYLALSFINAVVILLLSWAVFGMPVKGSVLLLLAESILFILMALSLGILISTVSNSQQMAMMLSMFALMLPTMLLSGFIFPIENMPQWLQAITLVMPPRWFIVIIKGIMVKGVGLAFIWKETLIIAGMALIFIVLSIRNFKIRLE
jgi:ABC-2 type transport system permease protein